MRKVTLLLSCALVLGLVAGAGAKLPATVDEFKARMETEAKEPKAATHLWFEAMYTYLNSDEAIKAKGREMMNLMTAEEDWERIMLGRGTLQKQPWLYQSYAKGATPANDYKMDPDNFELEFTREVSQQDGKITYLMIKCGGADNPRPFRMRKNKAGIWRMYEWSSLQVGVKKRAADED